MKITIDINQQDITNTTQEAFCGLLAALKEISSSSKNEADTETNNDGGEKAEKSVVTKQKHQATKTSDGKKSR